MLKITPKNNLIEFQLEVENASLKNTSTRLVVEVEDTNVIIPLTLDDLGRCQGEIPLQESWNGKHGNVKLEVIVENTYFSPFNKEVLFSDLKLTPTATVKKAKIVERVEKSSIKETQIVPKSISLEDDSMNSEIRNFFKQK